MFIGGLVSVTFRQLSPEQIIDLLGRSGLKAIEWGGDVHVPHGNLAVARRTARLTADTGLQICAYGSYYRVGISEGAGLPFSDVLDTALALGAPLIRVWAGNLGSAKASGAERQEIVDDSRRIADLAASSGVDIAFEYHSDTLTDTSTSALDLLNRIDRPNMRSYWQPPVGRSFDSCSNGLQAVLPHLAAIHAYTWKKQGDQIIRLALQNGESEWRHYLAVAAQANRILPVLLEFVADDDPKQFLRDAQTLSAWLTEFGGAGDHR
ncbi:MAG TPA: TIM barrel protein [bacterium]|nr:TIM barrel protein [bacterium]HPG45646.1 TIM barrel protein [bacterium]HPM97575.1 TIM barrel protein [bacterium]